MLKYFLDWRKMVIFVLSNLMRYDKRWLNIRDREVERYQQGHGRRS